MKIFIWERIDQVSHSYHTDGGLIVVAESFEEAIKLANSTDGVEVGTEEKPDITYDLLGYIEPKVVVFPDAGCC